MAVKEYIGPFRVERTHRGHHLLVHSYSQIELALRRRRRSACTLADALLEAAGREEWTWTDPNQATFSPETRAAIKRALQPTSRRIEWVRTDWLSESATSTSE